MSRLALFLLIAAPAPLPRPINVEAVVAVPDRRESGALAVRLRAGWFLDSAMRHGLRPGTERPEVEWIRERLRVSGEDGGRSLRLTLVRCEPELGLALMRAILSEYLCEVIPEKKAERERIKKREAEFLAEAKKAGKELKKRDLFLIREYFLQLVEREASSKIVTQQPTTVWARR